MLETWRCELSKKIKKITEIKGKKKKAYISQSVCDKSPFCPVKRICPAKAVEKKGLFMGELTINEEKCTGCGKCVSSCPHHAVAMR
jgi:Fe-S-cluster-containing hydrogenase component 2